MQTAVQTHGSMPLQNPLDGCRCTMTVHDNCLTHWPWTHGLPTSNWTPPGLGGSKRLRAWLCITIWRRPKIRFGNTTLTHRSRRLEPHCRWTLTKRPVPNAGNVTCAPRCLLPREHWPCMQVENTDTARRSGTMLQVRHVQSVASFSTQETG
jgi:hypothetical protein